MIQRTSLLCLALVSLVACGGDDAPITIDGGNDAGGVGGDGGSIGTCGDGVREGDELCDDGNTDNGDYCSAVCSSITGRCGDNVFQRGEVCEGNDRYCNDTCTARSGDCGDGVVQAVESCDPGFTDSVGCQNCFARGPTRCEGEPSLCGPTGLDWNRPLLDYTTNHASAFCSWLTGANFGSGSSVSCGGGIDAIPQSNAECTSLLLEGYADCVAPLRHILECYRGHNVCDFILVGERNRSLNACVQNVCTPQCEPNTWSCSGNIAHHCNQWGNGYEDTDCGTGTCNAAFPNPINASQVCGLAICTPNTWSCNGNTAQLCAPDGLTYARSELCVDATCISGGPANTPMNQICDINECLNGEHNCDNNATCTNTPGSFTCACNTGYEGDGITCTDINECANYTDNCDPNALCSNTAGGFTCACTGDYTGSGTTCLRDECALNLDNCGLNADCTDLFTDFFCTCNAGYLGDGIVCSDLDECGTSGHGCDTSPSACMNSDGGHQCLCPSGYAGDGLTDSGCIDINECVTGDNNCDDDADCTNVPSSYTCSCRAGYGGDGISCLPFAYLSSITLSTGVLTPVLDPNNAVYAVAVPLGTQSLSVTPTTTEYVEIRVDNELVVSGSPSSLIALGPGLNTVSIVLSGPNRATNTYTILITRGTASAYVKASNTGSADQFGNVVDISGDTMVVGVPFEDGSYANTGSVYVFARVGGLWNQQALLRSSTQSANGFFGRAVAISGDTIVVGDPFDDDSVNDSGAAHVFTRSGVTWTQQQKLKADNVGNYDLFGSAVAINGDSIVVSAPNEDSNATGVNGDGSNNMLPDSGAAYVFTRSGTVWSQQAYVKASNTGVADEFGAAVAISDDTIAIAGPSEDSDATGIDGDQTNNSATNSGAIYVFHRSGSSWSQQAYVKASNTELTDEFGRSIALYDDTLAVGVWNEDGALSQSDNDAANSGAVYVFTRGGATWSQQAYLKAANSGTGDSFGYDVALSADSLLVGSPGESGSTTGINSTPNDLANAAGAAYLFNRAGATWTQAAYVKASNTQHDDSFGMAVAIDGTTHVVGAPNEDSNATGINGDQTNNSANNSGAVYVF